jgi:hypothetical protein
MGCCYARQVAISTAGAEPRLRRQGDVLYRRRRKFMAVEVDAHAANIPGVIAQRAVNRIRRYVDGRNEVAADSRRFLMEPVDGPVGADCRAGRLGYQYEPQGDFCLRLTQCYTLEVLHYSAPGQTTRMPKSNMTNATIQRRNERLYRSTGSVWAVPKA